MQNIVLMALPVSKHFRINLKIEGMG